MARRPHVFQFEPDKEELARKLYGDACCSGESVLRACGSFEEAAKDPAKLREFYRQAHLGFARAQECIIERLVACEKQSTSPKKTIPFLDEELLLRKAADSIAWQLIGGQLYVARRLYSGQPAQRLTTSNFQSALKVAKGIMEPEFSKFALLSDTTTFIQIGDLAICDSNTGKMGFAELKEGKKNHEYLEALKVFAETRSAEYLKQFYEKEGRHGFDQLKRMAKQAQKMSRASAIFSTGRGIDPHMDEHIRVPDEPIELIDYEEELRGVIDQSKEKGWAIEIVDGCLYMGAYRDRFSQAGPAVFRAWFHHSNGGNEFPVVNLMECMKHPLALPIFSRQFSDDQVFDLLFGRCKVYFGLELNELMTLAQSAGVSARWASRKETAKLNRSDLIKVDNRAMVFEKEGKTIFLGDGLLARIVFHGTSPRSIVGIVNRTLRLGSREE